MTYFHNAFPWERFSLFDFIMHMGDFFTCLFVIAFIILCFWNPE